MGPTIEEQTLKAAIEVIPAEAAKNTTKTAATKHENDSKDKDTDEDKDSQLVKPDNYRLQSLLSQIAEKPLQPAEFTPPNLEFRIIQSGFEYVVSMSGMIVTLLSLFFSKMVVDECKAMFKNPRKCEETFCKVASTAPKVPRILSQTLIEDICSLGHNAKLEKKKTIEDELTEARQHFHKQKKVVLTKLESQKERLQKEMSEAAQKFSHIGFMRASGPDEEAQRKMITACKSLARKLGDGEN